MLILSRRPGQKVVFPGLGITIEVLRSSGSVARLGIEAPEDVAVLRDEILAKSVLNKSSATGTNSPAVRESLHQWKNKLNQLLLIFSSL